MIARKLHSGLFELKFEFDRKLQFKLKKLPGYYREAKRHYVRQECDAFDVDLILRDLGFMIVEAISPEEITEINELPELMTAIDLKVEPFPYQKKGIARSMQLKRVLIGDKPGLGKTLQAIGTVVGLKSFPCLVICPATLKLNWQIEFEKFSHIKAMVLTDPIKDTWPYLYEAGIAQVFITNFESLSKFFVNKIVGDGKEVRLSNIGFKGCINLFKSVIVDECHRVKDASTRQTKLVKGVTNGKEVILMLSGTPVVNKPKDLIAQLAILNRIQDFGGLDRFKERYIGAEYYRELNCKLNEICFFQRQKKDVLHDLPDKTRQIIPIEITTQEEYNHAIADLESYLIAYKNATTEDVRRAMRAQIVVSFGILKDISARGKIEAVLEHINSMNEQGEKVVVFSHLTSVQKELLKALPGAVHILGSDDHFQRQRAIERFQSDENVMVIICSIKAAGVGVTLTASSIVDFIELPWTQADCEQCEDRCHRIGAKDNVQANYFLGKGTIDEWIYYDVIVSKRDLSKQIVGDDRANEDVVIESFMKFFER